MTPGPIPPGSTAAVVLAAGGSSRMGRPKQLLVYQGRTLLRRAAETALASACRPVFVVLGKDFERMKEEVADLPVRVLHNSQWQSGIGVSIRIGVEAAASEGKADDVLLLLCDQPHVTPGLLDELVKAKRQAGSLIACCEYAGTVGVPSLFDRSLFPDLMKLRDDEGAKRIILQNLGRAVRIELPDPATDIDTPEDYRRLCS